MSLNQPDKSPDPLTSTNKSAHFSSNRDRQIEINWEHSFFLFGPRGAGKSTFLKQKLDPKQCLWIDLLLPKQEARYARNPDTLLQEVAAMSEQQIFVVIDEVQKVPKLLDVVHASLETETCYKRFILTGSSARKLRYGAANLLAGRAFVYHLLPFTYSELTNDFHLQSALEWGMLPKLYHYKEKNTKANYLKAYAHTYLKEEIRVEQLVRNLEPFRYFLEVAAQCNGKILNYSKIARDVGVSPKTIENYYSILEDTLLGFFLPSYHGSFRKQTSKAPKFYLFDTGISRALARMLSVPVRKGTNYYGDLFEAFIINEINKQVTYCCDEYRLSYLRTKEGMEIDLVVQRPGQPLLLIEIKSSENVQETQLKSLIQFKTEWPQAEAICLSQDLAKKQIGDITIWPWQEGIEYYFQGSPPS